MFCLVFVFDFFIFVFILYFFLFLFALFVLCPMLPVSLNYALMFSPSIFSNGYF